MRLINAVTTAEAISKAHGIPLDELVDTFANVPTIDAVPVVHGEWIENPTKDSVLCSYCHADWNLFDNDTYRFCYCPNCGAKMEDKPCG